MQNQIKKKIIQSNKRFSKICDQKNIFFIQGQSSKRLIFHQQNPQQIYVFRSHSFAILPSVFLQVTTILSMLSKYVLYLMLFDVNTTTILSPL